MIHSVCVACGASKLVSKHDGSLDDWEGAHRCLARQPKKKSPASADSPAPNRNFRIVGGKSRNT